MNRRKLLIALLSAGALSVGLGSGIMPASAEQYRVTVRLVTGGTQTLTIEAAGCPGRIDLGEVIACESVSAPAPAPAPEQTAPGSQTTPDAPADDTPDDEPGSTPGDRPGSGKKKGDKGKTTDKSRAGEGSSEDADSTPGGEEGDRRDGRERPDTNPDGSPSLSNPTVTLAEPGPATIGVPNFVIDRFKIPPFLLPIYKAAEAQYNIPWQILAAVNEIETNYGTNLNVSSAGAVGWMQFLPSTWKTYGTDANGDGRADPYNPVDAIFSAARYIKAAGGEKDIRDGLFAYNPANWYVDSVLLRAKVIGGLPESLVGSLTQLVEGRFPVAARARYADQLSERAYKQRVARTQNASIPVTSQAERTSIDIYSRAGAPVIAVNDGKIVKVGRSEKLGNYLILEDYAGNRYTYAQLGEVAPSYPAPKEQNVTQQQINDELGLPSRGKDPKPTRPASGGSQPVGRGAGKAGKPAKRSAPAPQAAAAPAPQVTKERLFANPTRPSAFGNGGREQIAATTGARDFETYGAYFAKVYGLDRKSVVFKPLVKGSEVVAGTVLGRMGRPEDDKAPYVTFGIKPAGKGAPRIDPKPILDGWKLLESTAIYRAQGKNPFITKSPSVGQMLLMTKQELGNSVLADPRIDIYECGRQDIRNQIIDKRVLISLKYLAGSGLKPTVSSLKCGHSKYVAGGGRISDHWYGRAVDIAAINGIPVLGNQEDGGITDIAIRRLLQLRGSMTPSQIISLRKYQGFDNTFAMSDHDDHIHLAFAAQPGQGSPQENAALKPRQWFKLIDRLGQIDNPSVPIKPSKFAVPRRDQTGRQPGD